MKVKLDKPDFKSYYLASFSFEKYIIDQKTGSIYYENRNDKNEETLKKEENPSPLLRFIILFIFSIFFLSLQLYNIEPVTLLEYIIIVFVLLIIFHLIRIIRYPFLTFGKAGFTDKEAQKYRDIMNPNACPSNFRPGFFTCIKKRFNHSVIRHNGDIYYYIKNIKNDILGYIFAYFLYWCIVYSTREIVGGIKLEAGWAIALTFACLLFFILILGLLWMFFRFLSIKFQRLDLTDEEIEKFELVGLWYEKF